MKDRNTQMMLAALCILAATTQSQQPPSKYTSRTFVYGKYYATDPESPGTTDTTDNS